MLIVIIQERSSQRLDNYMFQVYKNTPKKHVYRMIRKKRVRINGAVCVDHTYRLKKGDEVKMPTPQEPKQHDIPSEALQERVRDMIQEEFDDFWLINKPPGICVHHSERDVFGIIEVMRFLFDEAHLVHRIDRNTSGCLLVAKRYSALKKLQDLWREDKVTKRYWLLAEGKWKGQKSLVVEKPLLRKNIGDKLDKVVVSPYGKSAKTIFTCLKEYKNFVLLEAEIITGRTHQIRVHAASAGYPIVGDARYGVLHEDMIKKMFLHARSIDFVWEDKGTMLMCELTKEQEKCLNTLN